MKNKSIFKSVYVNELMMTVFISSLFSVLILIPFFKDSPIMLLIFSSFFKSIAYYIICSFVFIKVKRLFKHEK